LLGVIGSVGVLEVVGVVVELRVVRELGLLGSFYKFDFATKGGNPCKILNLHLDTQRQGEGGVDY